MTIQSSVNAASALPLTSLKVSASAPTVVDRADAQRLAAPSPSTIVTIPSASGIISVNTYTQEGTLLDMTPTATWASTSRDPLTLAMTGNYTASTMTGRFAGLGGALLDRFRTTGSDFSQSVSVASANGVGGMRFGSQQLRGDIVFTVQTASGVKVDIALRSANGGLSIDLKSSGTLSDAERNALAQLSDGFQQAIDGLGAVPPKLDLSGLTQLDRSVLASVNFQYNITGNGSADLSASFVQDSASRNLSVTSAAGTMRVDVDTSHSEQWGSSAQRAEAVANYLQQFDQAHSRGHGNASLMAMFEDGFAQMNDDYGTPSTQSLPGTAYAPSWLAQSDHAMLTGLADFNASITDAATSPNPMRPNEVDTFSYQVSQSTDVQGTLLDGTIAQRQQAHLRASYHSARSGGGQLVLTSSTSSQNYDYMQIDDTAESRVEIATQRGALLKAALSQSSSRSTRDSQYEQGVRVSDVTTPGRTSRSTDLLARLEPLLDTGDATHDTAAWQQALARIHSMILLKSQG